MERVRRRLASTLGYKLVPLGYRDILPFTKMYDKAADKRPILDDPMHSDEGDSARMMTL